MLNAAKYAKALDKYARKSVECPHCGMQTAVSDNAYSFCNFCEQRIDLGKSIPEHEKKARDAFAPVASGFKANDTDAALAAADRLLKGNTDPEQLYLLGLFYSAASWAKYNDRDYALRGFMEPNAARIRSGLELSAKAKECFYKAIKLAGDAQADNAAADGQLLFIRFMGCMRLRRKADAMRALQELRRADRQNALIGYAYAVYAVETGARNADKALIDMLEGGEPNSFYYLARYLALRKRLKEAAALLERLESVASLPAARELAYGIRQAQQAAEV
jgi:endogenous inhibitor of DNA gyrase (YacG/DUF329 family)